MQLDASSSSFANAAYQNRPTHSALSALSPCCVPEFQVLISLSATRVLVLRVCVFCRLCLNFSVLAFSLNLALQAIGSLYREEIFRIFLIFSIRFITFTILLFVCTLIAVCAVLYI